MTVTFTIKKNNSIKKNAVTFKNSTNTAINFEKWISEKVNIFRWWNEMKMSELRSRRKYCQNFTVGNVENSIGKWSGERRRDVTTPKLPQIHVVVMRLNSGANSRWMGRICLLTHVRRCVNKRWSGRVAPFIYLFFFLFFQRVLFVSYSCQIDDALLAAFLVVLRCGRQGAWPPDWFGRNAIPLRRKSSLFLFFSFSLSGRLNELKLIPIDSLP